MMGRWTALFFVAVILGCESVPPAAAPEVAWKVEHVEAQGALVSVWGSGPHDVWAVGGRQGRGLVLHNDGSGWVPVETPAKSFLWWIYGVGGGDVYAVGADGLILHRHAGAWQTVPSDTTATLYGLWARSADDVWAVGGNPWGAPGSAVVLRGNASGFHQVAVPVQQLPGVLYKIYGTPAGDVVAVGNAGTILRFDGAWKKESVPTSSPVVSLWGDGGERLFAVGGENTGELLHYDGTRWARLSNIQQGLGLFGIFKAPGQPLFAVGAGPRIVELASLSAIPEQSSPQADPAVVLHSVWGDAAGTVYAVGGNLYGDPASMTGVVYRRQ